MKNLIPTLSLIIISSQSFAGNSGYVDIGPLTASTGGIEIVDNNGAADGCNRDVQWALKKTHLNYNALVSVLLMAKASGKQAEFVLIAESGCLDPEVSQIVIK
jgi:hypothetical protein